VFVDKIEQHIFKARGEPVKRNVKIVKAVKDILCQNCGKFRQLNNSYDVKVVINFLFSLISLLRLLCFVTFHPLVTPWGGGISG
jgi:hypothetical protein